MSGSCLNQGSSQTASGTPGDAQALYRQGRAEWNKRTPDGLRQSLRLFEAAIEADPSLARAHAGLADAAALLALYGVEPPGQMLPRALQAARTALVFDRDLPSAHASLGLALYLYERDFQAAGESFQQSILLDPTSVEARQWYAMMLIAQGHYLEAVEQFNDALGFQPDSFLAHVKLGSVLAALDDQTRSRRHLEVARRINPDSSLLLRESALALLRQDRFEEALRPLRKAVHLSPDDPANWAVLGHVLARHGQVDDAREVVRRLRRMADESYVPPSDIAQVLAGLGDLQEAFARLDEALDRNDPAIVYIKFKPTYEPLRGDPRYEPLLRRIGLPLPAGAGEAR
ncbi:MAG TPA: tetratricopeptide repeat protein [Acidobacteriota bacterium]|nr:tetratricopeptide repeat protein [Acidobacteriota bacterium]